VRYPYLLGHFVFAFGLIVQVRSFTFLVITVSLIGIIYSQIIRYAEKIPYSNANADYIHYRSSVPALTPQLTPFQPEVTPGVPRKIDFLSILVNDNYTELFRWLSVFILLGTSYLILYTNNHFVPKVVATGLIGSLYTYRLLQEYQSQKQFGLMRKQEN
jgi:hypothetical protein